MGNYCSKCGANLEGARKYCQYCGRSQSNMGDPFIGFLLTDGIRYGVTILLVIICVIYIIKFHQIIFNAFSG